MKMLVQTGLSVMGTLPVFNMDTPNEISKMNWEAFLASGKASNQAEKLIGAMSFASGPISRNQLAESTGVRLSSVCARMNWLEAMGQVEAHCIITCPITQKLVRGMVLTEAGKALVQEIQGREHHDGTQS